MRRSYPGLCPEGKHSFYNWIRFLGASVSSSWAHHSAAITEEYSAFIQYDISSVYDLLAWSISLKLKIEAQPLLSTIFQLSRSILESFSYKKIWYLLKNKSTRASNLIAVDWVTLLESFSPGTFQWCTKHLQNPIKIKTNQQWKDSLLPEKNLVWLFNWDFNPVQSFFLNVSQTSI